MAQRIPVILNPNNKQHLPLADADTIRPSDIPVSTESGNTVRVRTDGIYVGAEAVPEYKNQYIDAVDGDDKTGDGSKTKPYRTINRAISNMIQGTQGYVIYCRDNQEHVVPSRVVRNISMTITGYPSFYDNTELLGKISQAYFDKYGLLATTSMFFTAFDLPTLIPDRVNALDTTSVGGPYGYMIGLAMVGGSLSLTRVHLHCGSRSMDVPITSMRRAALLCDNDLAEPASYTLTYCAITLGSMPLLAQRGGGANISFNVYGSSITGVADAVGQPNYIRGWGSDAPRVTAMVGGLNSGERFVTVDGVDYYERNTSTSAAAARDYTTGVMYHGGVPINIDAAFLYKDG